MELKPVEIQRWSWLASQLNEIIAAVNVLLNMQVSPAGAGNFQASKGNAMLTIQAGTGGGVPVQGYILIGGALYTGNILFEAQPTAA